MTNPNQIIFSYNFDSLGVAQQLENTIVAQELKNDGLSWVHLDANSKLTKSWLKKEAYYLDHLIVDALTAEQTRPRIMQFSDGLLIILRGVNLNDEAEPEDMVSVRIWVDDKRIITIERRPLQAIYDFKKSLDEGKKIKNSSEFLYNVLYQILSDISPFIYSLNEKVDALEDKVISTHDINFREEVLAIRTQSTIFKSYLTPQKKVISLLGDAKKDWIDDWAKRHFHENLDQISHLIEECEEALNRSHILHQELNNALSENLNKSIYKLSLITVIFMPLTFITGLLGMNVGGIPGASNQSAFWIILFLMMFLALIHFFIIKKSDRFK